MKNLILFILLFILFSCGMQINQEAGVSATFDGNSFRVSGSEVGNGFTDSSRYQWQWNFEYTDENGVASDCITEYSAPHNSLTGYSSTVSAHCLLYGVSGTVQNPILTPSVFIHHNIAVHFCLSIKNLATGEIVKTGICSSVNGNKLVANCSDNRSAGLVYNEIGAGTAQSPYEIFSAKQLRSISLDTSAWNKHFIQCDTIDLNGTSQFGIGEAADVLGGVPSLAFTGSFNGNGFKILNYKYEDLAAMSVGLFRQVSGASIKNIWMKNPVVHADAFVAPLIAVSLSATVDHIIVEDLNVSGVGGPGFSGATGIISVAGKGEYTDLSSTGNITGAGGAGAIGVTGFIDPAGAHVNLVHSSVSINSSEAGAGAFTYIAGNSVIENSWASGNVTCQKSGCGGFAGTVGENALVKNSYAKGNVTSLSESGAGGFVSNMGGGKPHIQNCYALGSVSAQEDAGGFIGSMDENGTDSPTIENSFAMGNVTCTGGYIYGVCDSGGFIGQIYAGTIKNSYALGNVSGVEDSIGGFIGRLGENGKTQPAIILNSYAKGNVLATNEGDVGGFVGSVMGKLGNVIENSYSSGNVIATGLDNIGGFLGRIEDDTEIKNSFSVAQRVEGNISGYFAGHISGLAVLGGIYYYDGAICPGCDITGTNISSLSYFYNSANAPMSVWNFSAIWIPQTASYPALR